MKKSNKNFKNKYKNFKFNGDVFNIKFGNQNIYYPEINEIHKGILFDVIGNKELVVVFPLVSPKERYFQTKEDFLNRNHNKLVGNTFYLKRTDSIILLDQVKSISRKRILYSMKCSEKKPIIISKEELKLIKIVYNKINSRNLS